MKIGWIDIFIIIMIIIFVYLVLTRIFGQSATDIQILTSVIGILGSIAYKHEKRLTRLETLFETKFETIEKNINEINKDIKEIKGTIKGE